MDIKKEKQAEEYLKSFEPKDYPYYLCYSGGKDSDVIRILAQNSGVKHEIHHNLTTVDAPETVEYVKSIPGVIIHKPELSMWKLIEKAMIPPTRYNRYCCSELKERGGRLRMKITGVRWDESARRASNSDLIHITGKPKATKKQADEAGIVNRIVKDKYLVMPDDNEETRRFVEQCYRTRDVTINPIVDWTDNDVWEYLHYYGCDSNPLYQCGYHRIGCVGCPLASPKFRKKDFERYPKYYNAYLHAFERMLKHREEDGQPTRWNSAEEVMEEWINTP